MRVMRGNARMGYGVGDRVAIYEVLGRESGCNLNAGGPVDRLYIPGG